MGKEKNISETPPPTSDVPPAHLSDATVPAARRQVEWFRQCPACWENKGGVGTSYKTHLPDEEGVRYYRCDCCGLSFNRDIRVAYEMVTKRVVTVICR